MKREPHICKGCGADFTDQPELDAFVTIYGMASQLRGDMFFRCHECGEMHETEVQIIRETNRA